MAERNLTDADITALSKAIGKQSSSGGGGTGGGGAKGTGMAAVDLGVDTFKKAIDPFGSAVGVAGKGVSALSDALNQGKDAWRDLSKSGAGFNNDIIGMTVAAAGSRLPLRDFAGVIKDNTDILGQLGGSVTRGAEAFAKMSKGFFESGATDSLKQLGYTNKDLNDVLALQAVTLRGSFRDEQHRNSVAIENASKLATEMDLMAKLTGKSREAQMEQMKKNQMDMQFEAAIRLKTQGMNAEDAAKFEANARSQLKDAQLRGSGDMFKEIFATGQIMSKEAAIQASVNQEQAAATQKQALASARGDEKAASEANREAQRAAVADANNTTKLGMVALGGAAGVAGKALTDSMGAQISYTKGLEATMAAHNLDKNSAEDRAKAQKIMEEEAKKAQSGKNEKGEQVDGVTKAAVTLENTVDKVRAGLITGLLEPLNKEVGPKLGEFAKNVDAMNKNFGGSGKDTSRAIEDSTKKGFAQGVSDKTTSRFERDPGAGGPLGIPESVGGLAGGGTRLLTGGIDKVNQLMEPPKRQGGSLDMTGGLFENWGKGTLVELHGMEGVMRPQDIEKIVETSLGGAKKSLSAAGASDIGKSMGGMQLPKFEMPKMEIPKGGIDLSNISKDILTSISSVSGGKETTVKVPDMAEMTKKFETSFADFNKAATKDIKFDDLSSSFKTSFDEFGSEISNYADLDDLMTPFEESFSSFNNNFKSMIASSSEDIADAMGGSKAEQAQSKIDAAIAAKDAAYEKLQKLWNEGSDEELNENHEKYAEELRVAKENLNKVVEESMGELTSNFDDFSDGWGESIDKVSNDISDTIPYDEFGDQVTANPDQSAGQEMARLNNAPSGGAMKEVAAGSSPTATQSRGITMDSFTIGPNGMPIAKPKSTSAAAPEKPAEKKASPGKAINPETGEEYTPLSELEKQSAPKKDATAKPGGDSKSATLDDLLKSMNALNTKVGQLITVSEEGHKSTTKAAKSGSNNLYTR